jgi:hypothetical protein
MKRTGTEKRVAAKQCITVVKCALVGALIFSHKRYLYHVERHPCETSQVVLIQVVHEAKEDNAEII